MKPIPLNEQTIVGAVSLEKIGEFIKPWRIFYKDKDFFTPDLLNGHAEIPAGVRITFETTSAKLMVEFAPSQNEVEFDVVIDHERIKTVIVQPGDTSFTIENLSTNHKKIEVYLSQQQQVLLKNVFIDEHADWAAHKSSGKKWLTYGSSITQCHAAESPSQTWPAITAKELDLDLICLGYSGQCQYEPMVARTIRDTPVDFISLSAGINIYGGDCYNHRTFQAIIIGFIQIIREKQPTVPIVLSSPIYGTFREDTPNLVGFTLIEMRKQVKEIVDIFRKNGDEHIFYVNGLDILSAEYENLLPDGLHPNAEGYKLMGHNFAAAFKPYFKKDEVFSL
ncbi:G-D-S-L family lipolytic protein [Neobacillus bataviensis LMG 21833]|uniref:G-D-S-L family lipolytic protein n=1 Tax=Neobacillus bataviensis LMG 21833 TaxID=1117379 RepID=K6DAU3_9BACI|nr:SGNH/GDSL hydrolase family protein [Neobacillus bataviensis]EKN65193.1 G-D-S-L family lipolytic protein [Neobacillus bataviensis LMG 21833]